VGGGGGEGGGGRGGGLKERCGGEGVGKVKFSITQSPVIWMPIGNRTRFEGCWDTGLEELQDQA
jgi:hypothetical protein